MKTRLCYLRFRFFNLITFAKEQIFDTQKLNSQNFQEKKTVYLKYKKKKKSKKNTAYLKTNIQVCFK